MFQFTTTRKKLLCHINGSQSSLESTFWTCQGTFWPVLRDFSGKRNHEFKAMSKRRQWKDADLLGKSNLWGVLQNVSQFSRMERELLAGYQEKSHTIAIYLLQLSLYSYKGKSRIFCLGQKRIALPPEQCSSPQVQTGGGSFLDKQTELIHQI